MTGARPRRVDAHQHFWRLARGDYGWLTPEKGPIYRDFGAADLTPLLARAGIDATVLVQAAPTVDETRFLLDLARTTPVVAGVVGWAPLDAPDAPDVVAALAREPALKGLRPMIHDIPDVDWMLGPEVARGLRAIAAADLTFDALVRPPHLPNLRRLLDRHPELRVVIDRVQHLALDQIDQSFDTARRKRRNSYRVGTRRHDGEKTAIIFAEWFVRSPQDFDLVPRFLMKSLDQNNVHRSQPRDDLVQRNGSLAVSKKRDLGWAGQSGSNCARLAVSR